MKQPKPRVSFCWECGKKLYGRHHEIMMVDGYLKILHKQCAKFIAKGIRLET